MHLMKPYTLKCLEKLLWVLFQLRVRIMGVVMGRDPLLSGKKPLPFISICSQRSSPAISSAPSYAMPSGVCGSSSLSLPEAPRQQKIQPSLPPLNGSLFHLLHCHLHKTI